MKIDEAEENTLGALIAAFNEEILASARGGCVVMRKGPTSVIPSAARDLVFSATYEEEIPRLHLGMTVATQSRDEEEAGRIAANILTDFLHNAEPISKCWH